MKETNATQRRATRRQASREIIADKHRYGLLRSSRCGRDALYWPALFRKSHLPGGQRSFLRSSAKNNALGVGKKSLSAPSSSSSSSSSSDDTMNCAGLLRPPVNQLPQIPTDRHANDSPPSLANSQTDTEVTNRKPHKSVFSRILSLHHRRTEEDALETIEQASGANASIDIINVMKEFPKSSVVQERGCAALTALGKDQDHHEKIAAEGGIFVILDSMKGHRTDPGLQGQACSALGNLAAFDDCNKITIAAEGGISFVIDAMDTHLEVPVTQEKACGALFNLAFDSANKVTIASAGGIPAIVRAMDAHPHDAGIQQNACSALWNLAGNMENSVHIGKADGIKAIIRGMERHQDHPGIQQRACGALRTLAIHSDNKVHIASAGGIAALIQAMETHPSSPAVQREACGALRNLTFHPDLRKLICWHRPHEVLKKAATNFPDECDPNVSSVLRILHHEEDS